MRTPRGTAKRFKATYECWVNMKTRCYNPRVPNFAAHGGRGIYVCDRWRDGTECLSGFQCFLLDMGPQPEGMTIERKDNDGPYEPGNCIWASRKMQALNRRSNHYATVDGVTLCAHDWAKKLGVSLNAMHTRVRKVGCEAAVRHYIGHGVRKGNYK